jgi:hypothetical protein
LVDEINFPLSKKYRHTHITIKVIGIYATFSEIVGVYLKVRYLSLCFIGMFTIK